MTAVFEKDAGTLLCPLARTFGAEKLSAKCRGAECAAWRWLPMSAGDPRFMSAVKREEGLLAAEAKEKDGKEHNLSKFHNKAVARVKADPNAFTYPDSEKDRGYCGMGGPVT